MFTRERLEAEKEPQVRGIARTLNISGRSNMRKADLIEAILAHQEQTANAQRGGIRKFFGTVGRRFSSAGTSVKVRTQHVFAATRRGLGAGSSSARSFVSSAAARPRVRTVGIATMATVVVLAAGVYGFIALGNSGEQGEVYAMQSEPLGPPTPSASEPTSESSTDDSRRQPPQQHENFVLIDIGLEDVPMETGSDAYWEIVEENRNRIYNAAGSPEELWYWMRVFEVPGWETFTVEDLYVFSTYQSARELLRETIWASDMFRYRLNGYYWNGGMDPDGYEFGVTLAKYDNEPAIRILLPNGNVLILKLKCGNEQLLECAPGTRILDPDEPEEVECFVPAEGNEIIRHWRGPATRKQPLNPSQADPTENFSELERKPEETFVPEQAGDMANPSEEGAAPADEPSKERDPSNKSPQPEEPKEAEPWTPPVSDPTTPTGN